MCHAKTYLLVLSVAFNIGFLFILAVMWFDHRKERLLLKMEKEEQSGWVNFWKAQCNRIEQKYNALKDRRRGE